jgi:hypothetical protein
MKIIRFHTAWLALAPLALVPALARAAGYNFSSFQYPNGNTVFTGIDDTNRITGYTTPAGGHSQGIFITAAGSLATINPPGAVSSSPIAINRLGGIVGRAFDGTNSYMFQDNAQGFGAITDLLVNQDVTGINASFDMVGNYTSANGQNAVYTQIKGNYHTLLPARCYYTHDPAINDDGVVVGNCVKISNASLVFTWSKGTYTYYTPPSNMTYVQATGINSKGDVAGWFIDSSGYDHGFVLSGGVFTQLDYPGAMNTQVLGINKAGKLVGSYFDNILAPAAFVATPQ